MPLSDARYYKTLLICPNKQFSNDLGPLLAHSLPLAAIHELSHFPSRREILDTFKTFDAKICLLDLSVPGPDSARTLDEVRGAAPNVPVIVLLTSNNPDLILACLRQGASDILIHPFTEDQLDAAVEKVARQLPPPQHGGLGSRTVAVIPAKAAAGASTIACSLALQCKRLGSKSVFLGDLDPLAGTVSFLLKLSVGYTFMDVLARAGTVDADLWKQMVTPAHGINVLLAPDTPPDPASDLPSALPVLEHAQAHYDSVILDCGSPYGSWNLSIARMSDEILLVCTNELASLQAVQRAIAYYEQNRIDPRRIKFVVNRYLKDAGLNAESLSTALGADPFQLIPSDPDAVQKSILEGKGLAANTSAGKGVAAIADRLFDFKLKDPKKPAAAKGGLRGIFGR